jgi:cytochrome c oxidase cbb3-type subunit I/II
MPTYPWLIDQELDISLVTNKISVMRSLGVPYPDGYEDIALDDLNNQADEITADLLDSGVLVESNKEIIALIAYLQRLGTDIKVKPSEETE